MLSISLSNCALRQQKIQPRWFLSFFFLLSLFISAPLYAAPDASKVLERIAGQVDQFAGLLGALAYIMGIAFILGGLMKLKHVGEQRSMMMHGGHLKAAMMYLIVGAMLLFLPTTWQYVASTFWSTPCTFCYPTDEDAFTSFFTAVYRVVALIGLIAFIRGLVILSHSGEQSQHGSMARAMTHIIGGILCMNMYTFVQVVFATLGIKM